MLAPFTALAEEPTSAAPAAAAPTDAPAAAPVVTTTPAVADSTPAAPAPAKGWKDLLVVEGLVDSYYQVLFTQSPGANSLEGAPVIRNFDLNTNSFTLSYAKVGLGLSAEKAGFRVDLGYGATGAIINSVVPPGAPPTGPTQATAFIVQQAYATLTPIEGLSIDFGKFVTTAGAEVIEANKNWLYSRSFLFWNIPLVHNGIRAGYKINDMVSVQASVVNGWNGQGLSPDNNAAKTFGLNAVITLPVGVGIAPTVYIGDEGSGNTRILADLVATYSTGPLGLNLNVDYLTENNVLDYFIGASAMAHYVVTDNLNVTGRFEFAQQALPGASSTKYLGATVGVALPFSGHYELRPEVRLDNSSPAAFGTPAGARGTVVTGTLAALAYF
jgi:hypothetical protein